MSILIRHGSAAGTQHLIRFDAHELPVDAPVANGGAGEGPQPHDLYDASLGACKALTVLLYARRKGYPLEDVAVDVERDDSQERQGSYRLRAALHLSGPLSQAQREELLRVAGRCPIHRLMTEVKTEIETTLA